MLPLLFCLVSCAVERLHAPEYMPQRELIGTSRWRCPAKNVRFMGRQRLLLNAHSIKWQPIEYMLTNQSDQPIILSKMDFKQSQRHNDKRILMKLNKGEGVIFHVEQPRFGLYCRSALTPTLSFSCKTDLVVCERFHRAAQHDTFWIEKLAPVSVRARLSGTL